jgi:hypothetical protein
MNALLGKDSWIRASAKDEIKKDQEGFIIGICSIPSRKDSKICYPQFIFLRDNGSIITCFLTTVKGIGNLC